MIRLAILVVAAAITIGLTGCCNTCCSLKPSADVPAEAVQSDSPADK